MSAYGRCLINGAWVASCFKEHANFVAALGQVESVQASYLLQLVRRNARTRFGAKHGFGRIRSVADYQERVPLAGYEALTEDIEAIAAGERGVRTADRVTRFQPTSGSSSATKLIPWTASLAREFRRGISPWVFALYRRNPGLLKGTAYWSVSPPATAPKMHGQLRVGFEHDADYLGFLGRRLYTLISSVPPGVAQCTDIAEFKTRTLIALLADKNLSLISIWSPTFLTALLGHFLSQPEAILDALGRSESWGAKTRAELLRSVGGASPDVAFFRKAWPKLQVVSCWAHGPSEIYAANLRRLFPHVEIQGKGLVATEAFVSLPLFEDKDPVLAVTSHFFEFQDPASGRVSLAHQLGVGDTYRVIVTTGGGLYRYPLGDLVRVTGFIRDAPCLQFIGRATSFQACRRERKTHSSWPCRLSFAAK